MVVRLPGSAKPRIGRPPGKVCDVRFDIRIPSAMIERVREHSRARSETTGAWFRRAVLAQLDLEDARAKQADMVKETPPAPRKTKR